MDDAVSADPVSIVRRNNGYRYLICFIDSCIIAGFQFCFDQCINIRSVFVGCADSTRFLVKDFFYLINGSLIGRINRYIFVHVYGSRNLFFWSGWCIRNIFYVLISLGSYRITISAVFAQRVGTVTICCHGFPVGIAPVIFNLFFHFEVKVCDGCIAVHWLEGYSVAGNIFFQFYINGGIFVWCDRAVGSFVVWCFNRPVVIYTFLQFIASVGFRTDRSIVALFNLDGSTGNFSTACFGLDGKSDILHHDRT